MAIFALKATPAYALEGTNRTGQSNKPATAKTPEPRKLNHKPWYRTFIIQKR
jgi:hypothetical protein